MLALIYKTTKPQVHNLEILTVMSTSQCTGIISTFAKVYINVTDYRCFSSFRILHITSESKMLPLCMSTEYHQDVFRNLRIPQENLLIQKVTYTNWSNQDHPFAQCNKTTYITITPLFLSHLNAGPKTKKLKENTTGISTRRVCLQESTEKQTEGQHKAIAAPNM